MRPEIVELTNAILKNNKNADISLVEKAYDFASSRHMGQKRKSGEPFIVHPVAVATMLAEMDMDVPSVIAGMLHDTIEDTSASYEEIKSEFSEEIAWLVDGVTKLKRIPTTSKEEQQAENLRKMFLSMASDIRVILIKLVDRLHNMRTLQYVNTDSQITKARETLEIYTPLAHRLGMTKIKWELEDLCLKYLEPETYYSLIKQINTRREEQESYISRVLETIGDKLKEMGIEAHLDGRPKHLYSIRKKMVNQGKTLDQIYDLLAIRLIVNTVSECYTALGVIHELYKPMPGRIKDYIAMPKPNMYQSLHTTLIGPEGKPFEAQIRTWDMHRTAEIGIAAHWKYKEGDKGGRTSVDLDNKLQWVRNLFDNQKEVEDSGAFMETFKMDLFTDEVFVFTPKGDVKSLPFGSTPIDFAYSIHSAVGNKMIGAKVNGEIKPLNYKLKNGDFVEVLTSSSKNQGPSRDWLNIVKSSEAKSKIRQWFKKEGREENIQRAKEIIEKELRKQSYSYSQLFKSEWIDGVLKKYRLVSIDDLYNLIGFGEVSALKIISYLKDCYQKTIEDKGDGDVQAIISKIEAKKEKKEKERPSENGIIVKDIENCLVRLARCCNPVHGDDIVGYITRGRGVSVHRVDCPNVVTLDDTFNRMIDVRWAKKIHAAFDADLTIKAVDISLDKTIINNIISVVGDARLELKAFSSRKTRDNYLVIDVTVEIRERSDLDMIISKFNSLSHVVEVTRSVK